MPNTSLQTQLYTIRFPGYWRTGIALAVAHCPAEARRAVEEVLKTDHPELSDNIAKLRAENKPNVRIFSIDFFCAVESHTDKKVQILDNGDE